MKPCFDRVAVIGVGLLGGSLGLALKELHLAGEIRGVGRRQSSLQKALECGAVDKAFLDVREPVADADLIVICTPAAQITEYLDLVRVVCRPTATVTDVASTKQLICGHARDTWPRPCRFVGSHPMAGSEKYGVEHARADLYAGCTTIIEEGDHLEPQARRMTQLLWESVGAQVVSLPPTVHDALAARSSHTPHVLAACAAIIAGRHSQIEPLIGRGFRDLTRIAASRPEIWRDICMTNSSHLSDSLREVEGELKRFRAALESGDSAAVEAFFNAARQARREVLGE